MSIVEIKLAACVLILGSGLAGGLLPLRFDESPRNRRFLAIGNGFAGGIFLGAGLIHMLGDAQGSLAVFEPNYPLALLIAGGGFLAVLFLEMVALRGREDVTVLSERHAAFYPFLLLVVLSVHSIIAGMAVGLEGSTAAVVGILVAILAHKGSAAFALGVSLKTAGFPWRRFTTLVIFFSFMTPIGVIVGMAFAGVLEGPTALLVEGIFDALAAGSFVYVAVLDIIGEAFEEKHDLGAKFAVLTLGFLGMALLAWWT